MGSDERRARSKVLFKEFLHGNEACPQCQPCIVEFSVELAISIFDRKTFGCGKVKKNWFWRTSSSPSFFDEDNFMMGCPTPVSWSFFDISQPLALVKVKSTTEVSSVPIVQPLSI